MLIFPVCGGRRVAVQHFPGPDSSLPHPGQIQLPPSLAQWGQWSARGSQQETEPGM